MARFLRLLLVFAIGCIGLTILIGATLAASPSLDEVVLAMGLAVLIFLANVFSVPIGGGVVSLMLMTVIASYLVIGPALTGWAVILSAIGHALVRQWRTQHRPEIHEPEGWLLVEVTVMNIGMHCLALFSAAFAFERLGGDVPLLTVTWGIAPALVAAIVAYMLVNYALVTIYFSARGREALSTYLQSLPRLLLYEGSPMVLAPLAALIYTRLGPGYFLLYAMSLVVFSLISHSLAFTSRRLERRLRELSSLQAVGQVLSESLDVDAIIAAIYEQVANMMPATSFYVALYDRELDEISFPLTIRDGERVLPGARRPHRSLTEYLLETKRPLLIPRDVAARVEALGLEHIGEEAACWLGIPILAGDEALGIIAVQSFDTPEAYDRWHMEILQTIAAQAAVAIQNARLYERTDEALARRVQELDSVLRTTRDGVLLLDLDWRVLALNRALAGFVGVAKSEFLRRPVDEARVGGVSLVELIGYTPNDLRADCERLRTSDVAQIEEVVVLGPAALQVERTLTPVRDRDDAITGWLLVFRDLTEELELERLRDEMTSMLVHDLRSPISLMLASLSMLKETSERADQAQMQQLIDMARRSGDRILTLVDDLLDIGQLERGQLPLTQETVPVEELFEEIWTRYKPMATSNNIELCIETDGRPPSLYVDRSLVTRVLANLVDNAIKFTSDGGRVAMWARHDRDAAPGALLIGVEDTGPGIPTEARPLLFEKFQQVPNIRGRRRGTGLGLPFCKLAVEAHGGRIWVESEVGKGSTFLLTLPVEADAEAAPASSGDVQ